MLNNKLNIDEFFDEILCTIDESVFSNIYIDENREYFKEINFFLYEQYEEDRVTFNLASKLLKTFIELNFKYKPGQSNILRDDFGNLEEW